MARDNFGSLLGKTRKSVSAAGTEQVLGSDGAFTEKRKIAEHLHRQGIDPEKWIAAEPLPYPDQERFRQTGLKPNDLHFEVAGRLYRWAPHLVANDNQRRAAVAEFAGKGRRPIEELVDLRKVAVRHPFNQRHEPGDEREALAFFRSLAAQGIDPVKAHLGDPLPPDRQEKLKGVAGIPGAYRHPKDGYLYLKNPATAEDSDVTALRRSMAEKSGPEETARRILGVADEAAAQAADQAETEAVAQHHLKAWQARQPAARADAAQNIQAGRDDRAPVDATDAGKSVPVGDFVAAVEKAKTGGELSPQESALIAGVTSNLAALDIPFDPMTIDLAPLKESAAAAARAAVTVAKSAGPAIGEAAGTAARIGAVAAEPLGFAMLPLAPLALARALGQVPYRPDLAGRILGRAPVPGEQAWQDMQRNAVKPQPLPEAETGDRNPVNDNSPPPVNDNQPSPGPNPIGAVVEATTTRALSGDEKNREIADADGTSAPVDFNPDSRDMADFQHDFAHAIRQGQLPQIWLDGKQITSFNPHGSRGKPSTRKLDLRTMEAVKEALEQCRGVGRVEHIGGAKKNSPQFHIGDPDSPGNRNSVRLDLTMSFDHGDFNCLYHINSIDTDAAGFPTGREQRALDRTRGNIVKIVSHIADLADKRMANFDLLTKSGYALDTIAKATANDDREINKNIREFMAKVFSCARIMRECRRTHPEKADKV